MRALGRLFASGAASILFGLIAAGIAFVWLFYTESAARLVLPPIARMAGVAIDASAVRGALAGPIAIERLSATADGISVRAQALGFGWRLAGWRALELRDVRIGELIVETKPGAAPAALPQSLALPVRIDIEPLEIGTLELLLPAGVIRVRAIEARVSIGPERHRLELQSLVSMLGRAHGELAIDAHLPFALSGNLAFERTAKPHPARAQLAIGGTLERMRLDGDASVDVGRAQWTVVATPYARLPLDSIELSATDVDPAKLEPAFPQARLAARVRARMSAADRFSGSVEIRNARAGPLDAQRLPIHALRASIDGHDTSWRFEDLIIDLGGGGALRGRGDWQGGALALALKTVDLDLAAIVSRMRPTRLAGTLDASLARASQSLRADLVYERLAIRADASYVRGAVDVRAFSVRIGDGVLSAEGSIVPGDRFEARGSIARFNPAALGRFPEGQINASFRGSGRLAAPVSADVRFEARESVLAARPFEGEGRLILMTERVESIELRMRAAGNLLEVHGALGAPQDEIQWRIEAPMLAALGLGLQGALTASGRAAGPLSAPRVVFTLAGERLSLPGDLALGAVQGDGEWNKDTLDAKVTLAGARAGGVAIANASLALRGSVLAHTASVRATGPELDVEATLAGGYDGLWRGTVERLRTVKPVAVELRGRARAEAALDRVAVSGAELAFAGGTIELERFEHAGERIAVRGAYRMIELASVRAILRDDVPIGSDLVASGTVDLAIGTTIDGRLSLRRERGDFWPAAAPDRRVGLDRMSIEANARAGRVDARLEMSGDPLGRLAIAGELSLARLGSRWGVPGQAPVALDASIEMRSTGWLAAAIIEDAVIDGGLAGTVQVRGTAAAPGLAGRLEGRSLVLRIPSQDFALRDGEVVIGFDAENARIERARFAGASGSVSASGAIAFAGMRPKGSIRFELDRLDAIADTDRTVVLSGALVAAIDARRIDVRGDLVADRGEIRVAEQDAVRTSEDVVVIGRASSRPATARPVARDPARTTATVDVGFDLGERFHLRGRGLDARLAGKVRLVTSEQGAIRLTGTVRSVEGTYTAYGQRLTIERGVLTFNGSLDNPALNVLAVRKGLPVEAGVAITGFALQPRVTLASTPVVSDAEKLSWLVLGHGLEGGSASDYSLLGAAAGALLSPGDSVPLQTRIAQAVGLDQIEVKSTGPGLEGAVVAVGKRLSSKLTVTIERSILNVGTVLKLRYQFNPRWSVQTQAGLANTIDLFYTLSFD